MVKLKLARPVPLVLGTELPVPLALPVQDMAVQEPQEPLALGMVVLAPQVPPALDTEPLVALPMQALTRKLSIHCYTRQRLMWRTDPTWPTS